MKQSCLLALLVVLWMMNDAQDIAANPAGMTVRSGFLSQSVTKPSNASIKETITSGTDIASMADVNSSENINNRITGILAPCDPPTAVNVGSITTTSASVSFTSAGTGFIAEYGPVGFTPGTGASAGTNGTIVTGPASPIVLTGLADGTAYDVYVRNNCGVDGYSANAGPVSFTTTCGTATIPYLERFDNPIAPAVPVCITVENVNGGNTWRTVSTDFDVSHPNLMRLDYDEDHVTPANDWFYTKGLNLTGGTSYRLRFQYRNSDGISYTENLEVKYGVANNAASMTTGTLFSHTGINSDIWKDTLVDFIPSVTGVYYIGFHGFSNADQAFLCVDNVSVIATPSCNPPIDVMVVSTTSTGAIVSFSSPGGNSFYLEYGPLSFSPGTGASAGGGTVIGPIGTSPITIPDGSLAPETIYDVYVRRDCGGGSFSPNSLPGSFKTIIGNDDAPGAYTLTVGAGCTGASYTNADATAGTNEVFPSCSGSISAPVWFKFVAPVSGAVRISTDLGSGNTLTDSKIGLFSATNVNDYSTFNIIACDDDGGSVLGSGNMSVMYATGLTFGTTYYIAVDKYDNAINRGTFCIAVDELDNSMIAGTASCGSSQGITGLNTSYTGWVSLVDNSSKLVANVKQTAGTATDISANVNVNTLSVRQDPVSLQYYLDRNYKINAVGATSADVQFFFLNTELTALAVNDVDATLSNLKITRQSGAICQADYAAANGTNSEIVPTGNGTVNGVSWVTATTPGFSNFYLHSSKLTFSTKIFLQGAYSSGLSRHKDVTTTWANILNAQAKNQPYNIAAFGNYAGTESVASFAAPSAGVTTDILDWVLLEIKNSSNVLMARRAAFVREDGQVVDLDGTSAVKFAGLVSGDYYITIRHRNHLGLSSQNLLSLTAKSLGVAPVSGFDFDFSAATDADIFGTAVAYKIIGSTNVMICGNANSNTNVRYANFTNDPSSILLFLGGSITGVASNVYSSSDVNMDGTVRYANFNNDPGFLLTNGLGGSITLVITEQKR